MMAHSEARPTWNVHTQAEVDALIAMYRERTLCDRIVSLETAVKFLEEKGTE